MPILTRTKTQQDRFVTLSKFDLDRCYKLACAKLSEEVPFKLTKTYAQALYSPSFEDIVSINNLQAVQDIFYTKLKNNYEALNSRNDDDDDDDDDTDSTISSETSTTTSFSTIDTFPTHDIDWIRSSVEDEENGASIYKSVFPNMIISFMFIIVMIILRDVFELNDNENFLNVTHPV